MVNYNPEQYNWINSEGTDPDSQNPDLSKYPLPSPDRDSFNPDVPRDIDFLNETISGYLVQLKADLGPDGQDTTYEFVLEDGKLRLKSSDGVEYDVEITAGDSGKLIVTTDDDNNTIELDVDLSDYYTKDEVDDLTPTLPENIAYTDERNQFVKGQDFVVTGGEIINVKKVDDDGNLLGEKLQIWADGKITQEDILPNTQDKEFVNRKNLTDAIDAISTPDNIVNLDDDGTRDVPPTDRIVMYVGSGEPSNWATINEAMIGALFTSSSGEGLWIKEAADADGWVRADDTEYTEHLKGGEANQILAKASEEEGHYIWKNFTLPDGQEPYPGISDEDGNEIQIRSDGLFVPEVVIPEIPEVNDDDYAKLKGGNEFTGYQHMKDGGQFDAHVDLTSANFWGNVEYNGWITDDKHIVTKEYLEQTITEKVAAVYDSGWQTINGQKFRRVNYTVFGQGTISTPDVADLTDTEFVPTHPISVSAHYDADKTISNPVYSDGPLLKVNSQNGEDVVWSGSWSTNAEIPNLPDTGADTAKITNLADDPTETSVTLTWDVE